MRSWIVAAALLLGPAAAAQSPVAPGSGFATAPASSFSGGAPVAPGSGFAPSTAGTLGAGPRVTGSAGAGIERGILAPEVATAPGSRSGRHHGHRARRLPPNDYLEPADPDGER